VEEEEHASAGLISDPRRLFLADRTGEQQPGSRRPRRREHHPALVLGLDKGVFHQDEAETAHIKGQGLVVVANDECHCANRLLHAAVIGVVPPIRPSREGNIT
jgi:hypothetical protein